MNFIPINGVFEVIKGDISFLPSPTSWLPICAEMQSAFYLIALPQGTFHVFQLFRNGKYIGLGPSVEYRPSCRVLPMGWASSVGIMQQVSRQVLLMKGLPKSLETQKVDGIPRWFTQAARVQALKGRGGK